MGDLVQALLNGLMAGSIYGLIAVGLAIVYGVMHIPHFALGAHVMVGAYVTYLLTSAGVNYWLALLVATTVLGAFGAVVHWGIFDPLRGKPHTTLFIAAFGLLLLLQGVALLWFGPDNRIVPPAVEGSVSILGVAVTYQRLIIIIVAGAAFAGVHLLLNKTPVGRSIRAVAQEPFGARVVGISPRRMAYLAMFLGSALAGLAGSLLAPISQVFPTLGDALVLKAFVIIILAGMGSILGAMISGLAVGLIEALASSYVSADWSAAYALVLLLVVLAVRPQGLFGKRGRTA